MYGEGKDIVSAGIEKIRGLLERCDAPQGFLVSHGLGGGAGSGMGGKMLNCLIEEHSDLMAVTTILFPHLK